MLQKAQTAAIYCSRLLGVVAVAATLSSCSHEAISLVSTDIKSATGESVHCSIRLSTDSLQPLGYVIDIKNTGKSVISFRPGYPSTKLVFPGDNLGTDIFNAGQSADPERSEIAEPVVDLKPGDLCTLQLLIKDLNSPLRGKVQDCQLWIKTAKADQDASNGTGAWDFGYLHSPTFRISVP